MKPWPARVLLLLWTAVLVAILVPWGDYTGHTHWGKVVWIPFGPPVRVLDVAANVLVFVPFGSLWRQSRIGRFERLAWALTVAATLSIGGEWLQVYSHLRIPSVTDVVTNLMGVVAGWMWASR